jgi:uncharacterized protein YxeA
MKKIIIPIVSIALLTACGGETMKTVVVDQSGKVIETKVANPNRFIYSESISVQGQMADKITYTDTKTGCKYIQFDRALTPLYDEFGHVEGCKKVTLN